MFTNQELVQITSFVLSNVRTYKFVNFSNSYICYHIDDYRINVFKITSLGKFKYYKITLHYDNIELKRALVYDMNILKKYFEGFISYIKHNCNI